MSSRMRIPAVLASLVALLLAAAGPAGADPAYDKVEAAFTQSGGQLDPCSFTQAELEAAIRGIPAAIRGAVPDVLTAMEEGIAAHERGDCKGRPPAAEEGTTGGAAVPPVTSTPTTPAPAVTTPAPVTTAPAPVTTAPAPVTPAPAPVSNAEASGGDDDALLIGLIAAGALVLLALMLWGWARMRGWDPGWVARVRHAWGEAGFRTTSTWSEFTDWLRLGR